MVVRIDAEPAGDGTPTLSEQQVAEAARAVRVDGAVVLGQVVLSAHLSAIGDRMLADLERILEMGAEDVNFAPGHLQQDAPPFRPYLFRDVLCNDAVIQVTHALLGPGVHNSLYSADTNMPGSAGQPVHVDEGQLWPDLPQAHPAGRLTVNIALTDVDETNASIEIWPGTHQDTLMSKLSPTLRIDPERLEQRRGEVPPERVNTRSGDVLIRDGRMWHRGTPNLSDRPRIVLSMVHGAAWIGAVDPPVFAAGTQDMVQHDVLRTVAGFTAEPDSLDYLKGGRAYVAVTHR